MHWLIHNKFDYDKKVRELIYNLDRFGIGYTRANVVPFSTEIGFNFESPSSEDEARANGADGVVIANIAGQTFVKSIEDLKDKRIFTYGSYTMANHAAKVFDPGAYVSPLISMVALNEHYGKEMLNHDMVVGKIREIDPDMDMFFIRPVEDTKSIVGAEYTKAYYTEWKARIMEAALNPENYSTVTPDTMICIAPCKRIDAEYRCFVVNGRVATVSQYKMRRLPHFTSHVDDYIIAYVNDLVSTWQPDKAFVLDVALCDDKLSVIEANCINSSGLYEIDTQKLIMAVEDL